jgi:formylglycine-generating enzyme required for sulfatase activity
VVFCQRIDGSKIIDIYYDLSDIDNDCCTVTLKLSDDYGATYSIIPDPALTTGDIGSNVIPGQNKHILWYARYEGFFLDGDGYCFRVEADDGTPPLIPADFVLMPARTFIMGRTSGYGDDDELPPHNVTLSAYLISKYEATQAEWEAIMGYNPAEIYGIGPDRPVYNVSWYAILKYCNLLSLTEGYTPCYSINGSTDPADWGEVPSYINPAWNSAQCNWSANGYRLPTDAEWEFAARSASNYPDYPFSGSFTIGNVAWYGGNNNPNGCKPVGTKNPNAIGLYDMSGNVWEYCWDWQGYFLGIDETNPSGPDTGSLKIARGGYWLNNPQQCRVYERSGYYAFSGSYWMGFRLAMSYSLPTY